MLLQVANQSEKMGFGKVSSSAGGTNVSSAPPRPYRATRTQKMAGLSMAIPPSKAIHSTGNRL